MLNLVLVGGGGFLGSVLRYLAGLLTQSLTGSTALPYGTLVVNVLGCLIIGLASSAAAASSAALLNTANYSLPNCVYLSSRACSAVSRLFLLLVMIHSILRAALTYRSPCSISYCI